MIIHHDERAANALQRLLNDSGIIEVTLHDFRRIGIEATLSGSLTRALKGIFARASALAAAEPTRPVAPVNKIIFLPIPFSVQFASRRCICVAVVPISTVVSDNAAGATSASHRYARLGQ